MCRILINTDQLAETASLLTSTAAEYQAIGAGVAGCDCGCMPADVAAVVDSVTTSARAGLDGLAGELVGNAQELGWRSDVPQDGGTVLVIGGDSTPNNPAGDGMSLVVSGDAYPTAFNGGGGDGLVIHSEFGSPAVGFGQPSGGIALVIAGSSDPAVDDNSYLEQMRSGQLPDPSGVMGPGGLFSGIRSASIPIGGVTAAHGLNSLDLAGTLIGGYGPDNAQGFNTYDRGIQWGALGTSARTY